MCPHTKMLWPWQYTICINWVNAQHWVYRCLVHVLLGSALHSSQGAEALELIHMPALFFSGISLTDCTVVPYSSIRTTVFSRVWVAQVKQPAQLKDAASAHVLCSSLDKVIQRLHLVQCAKWLWGAKCPLTPFFFLIVRFPGNSSLYRFLL